VIKERIDGWASGKWLRRTAILFQLKYKDHTEEELLYRYILLNNESREFFI
jgi:3-methyladenine DNA glycosylase AlkD